MMTLPRERLSYSSPFTRPPLKLPGKARMVVWSVVNIEEWEITRPMARQLSQPPMGQTPIPDMPNWTWYEYGMRVGFWRLKRALQNAGVTPTMSINAKVCETYPEVAAAARDANWEFMAHAFVQMPIQQIEDQRAVIRQSCDVIEKFTGKRPTGWLGPGRGQTFDTLDYVTECGLTWFGDWILDDQPLWVKTRHGPILAVPYSAEINDITLMISHHHESDVLLKRTIDAFDRLYAESAELGPRHGDRRAPLRHRRRAPHQIFRRVIRLHQPPRRGALDRAADLRLVCRSGAGAVKCIRRQRRLVLAAVDLDFAFGRLAPAFGAPLARDWACLVLGAGAGFPGGGPGGAPGPLLETVLARRSTEKLSPTPVAPDVVSTVTNSPTIEVGEIVNRKNPKVLSLYTFRLRGFPLASVPEPGVCAGGRRFGGFNPGRL